MVIIIQRHHVGTINSVRTKDLRADIFRVHRLSDAAVARSCGLVDAHKACSDVVLETKVLVSRRLEDRNKVLVLVLVLTKKS